MYVIIIIIIMIVYLFVFIVISMQADVWMAMEEVHAASQVGVVVAKRNEHAWCRVE